MPSTWILTRTTPTGGRRYQVRYRLGGRESRQRYGGSFRSRREAEGRARYIVGELAGLRVPSLAVPEPAPPMTVAQAAGRWQAGRIDVAAGTRAVHRKALRHVLDAFAEREPASLSAAEVAAWVGALAGRLSPGTVAKALGALRMVLDHEDVQPNPARDRRVRLPRQEREEIEPPSSAHVERILAACAPRHRLALIVLEATGMRVGELESLRWGDLDLDQERWRIARQHEKGRRGRWVPVPPDIFAAVCSLRAREDRDPDARVFPDAAPARLRTEMARACRATGIPLYSPHDLRHRRISLWHRAGISWAQIGDWAGQRSRAVTADVYSHVLADGEVDHLALLGR